MGTGAYDSLESKYKASVVGIEYNEDIVDKHIKSNRCVIHGDGTDTDFWERVCPSNRIKMVVLAMTDHASNMQVLKELKNYNFKGRVTATAVYDDEIDELKKAGADEAFNFYAEAGAGFADHICEIYEKWHHSTTQPTAGRYVVVLDSRCWFLQTLNGYAVLDHII